MEIKSLLSIKSQPSLKGLSTMEIMNPNFYKFNPKMTQKDRQLLDSINQIVMDYALDELKSRPLLNTTTQAQKFFLNLLKNESQEKLVVAFINSKSHVLEVKTIFIGSVSQSVAHPREIFREAVKYPTVRIIIAHNHPSGDTTPSDSDIKFTKLLIECGDLMGIEVIDHIIVGHNEVCSLREDTYLW
ncbi:DNA repair protein RadC [Aerococcaceae bacterium NML191292]|nr:DNA repair protein RadC [Aerococcaceae bacterium NML191292]